MSRRERVLLVLGVLVAIGLVVYPLGYRLSTEQRASVAAAQTASPVRSSPSMAPTAARTVAPPTRAPTPVGPTPSPIDMSWQAEATLHRLQIGESFVYVCPPNGTFGPIWGSDTYTDDSSVCTAGVHKGVITREQGGSVTIIIRKALKEYKGTTRNGVRTEPYGEWEGSYQIVAP